MTADITTVLDLETYPLNRPDTGAYRALVSRCRADLDRDGMFNLPGFMRGGAIEDVLRAAVPKLAREAFTHERLHNIYFRDDIPGLPADHPALCRRRTINHTLCADQLAGGALDAAYTYAPLIRFLAETMDMPALYPMDDPLARFNVMGYGAGEALNWHFDRSEFTTTLLLQAPEAGGAFEYRTGLRTGDDPNYAGVARLLQGEDPMVRRLRLAPGTLNVFRGRNTAHRVTPVRGARQRIIAVFTYYDTPGRRFTAEENTGFYGRAG